MCFKCHLNYRSEFVRHMQWQIQDFPKVGVPTLQGGCQHTILSNFPKNCMKLNEFGPLVGCASLTPYPLPPLRSTNDKKGCQNIVQVTMIRQ